MRSPAKQPNADRQIRASSNEDDPTSTTSTGATPPSTNLWVGNLSLDTTESELSALFSKYGPLDRVTTYPSRNYAFVYFKHVGDAKSAKDSLQGTLVRGTQIRIQFAKPAKASKHLWIGGVSPVVTRKELEEEFSKFGEIAEIKLLKDRNSAFVDYYKIEDAADAMKNMNGKRLCGEQILVDFVRSQPSRREWSDYHDSLTPSEPFRGFPETSLPGHKRPLSNGSQRGGQPSKVLWIRFPPTFPIDEQMLHNALILFGEIERMKTFRGRNYSYVEFRSIEEAWRAKEGLQGRLFNDPRIQIMFSNSDSAPGRDDSPFFQGSKGQADTYFSEPPFGPPEIFTTGNLVGSNNYPGPLPPSLMRGEGNSVAWRRPSPSAPGILPAPSLQPPVRSFQGARDEYETRDPKRSRIDAPPLVDDVPFHKRIGSHDRYVLAQTERDSHGQILHSPIRMKGSNIPSHGEIRGVQTDHCWRGLIAKGGSAVCHARCIPVGKGLDSPIPEVVNCSARTGLDMLEKHYAEASGFDIVFFLPDSEDDFASYTEFLRYLGLKNRAGVAKFDDGTTLFLVPPSDFLSNILKVSGPERLYGVVLRLPPQSVSVTVQAPKVILPPTSQYIDRQQLPPQITSNMLLQFEDQTRLEYGRGLREDLLSNVGGGRLMLPHAEESHATAPTSLGYVNSTAAAHAADGISLSPEILATLATLVPSGGQQLTSSTVQLPLNASTREPPLTGSATYENSLVQKNWKQDHDGRSSGILQEQAYHPSPQTGQQINNQSSHQLYLSNYGKFGSQSDYPIQTVPGTLQVHDSTINTLQASKMPSKPVDGHSYPLQGGMAIGVSNQQSHLDASYVSHQSYGMQQTVDMGGVHNSFVQQPLPSISSSQQPESVLTRSTNKANMEVPTQLQQLQAAVSNSSQSMTADETDKNQRYQSTLQFAASLLLQIQQQQQQQGSVQSVQRSENQ